MPDTSTIDQDLRLAQAMLDEAESCLDEADAAAIDTFDTLLGMRIAHMLAKKAGFDLATELKIAAERDLSISHEA